MEANHHDDGRICRRSFLLLSGVLCAGCTTIGAGASHVTGPARNVDAGPAGNYAKDGVYDPFRDRGFFIIRKDGKLLAISAICTHRSCKLTLEKDRSYYCECHGSTFDQAGKVTEGPAKLDLPYLTTQVDSHGHLIVQVPAS